MFCKACDGNGVEIYSVAKSFRFCARDSEELDFDWFERLCTGCDGSGYIENDNKVLALACPKSLY